MNRSACRFQAKAQLARSGASASVWSFLLWCFFHRAEKCRNLVPPSNVFGFLESKGIRSHQTRSPFGGSMIFRRSLFAAAIVVAVTSLLPILAPAMAVQTTALPAEISDKDFWRMIVDLSEPDGTYPYENFVSNELQYQDVVPALKAT